VLERTRHLLAHERDAEHARQRLAELMSQHVPRPEPDDEAIPRRRRSSRLVVKDNNRFVMLRTAEIDWISSAGDYVKLYSRGRTFLIRLTMSEIEEKLEPERFARIHRSTIVNLDRVDEIRPLVHGDFDVLLKDGTTLRLSRSYRERLLSEVIR
jgi:two-component system LytT family response regulator